MGYLLTEIVVYLVIAGLIGFAFGWLVRDGGLAKYFDKLKSNKSKEEVVNAKSVNATTEEVKRTEETKSVEEAEAVVEVATQEQEDVRKPTLLTKAPGTGVDKLSTIKGIGPVLEKKLNELGIYSFEQIASWNVDQEVWIGTQMAFPKRVTKDEWVKQAKELLKNK